MSAAKVVVQLRRGCSDAAVGPVIERITRAFGTRVTQIAENDARHTVEADLSNVSEAELNRLRDAWFVDMRQVAQVTVFVAR